MSMDILPVSENRITPELRIASRAPGLGTASEELSPEKVGGSKMQIGFNINFLIDGLKAAGSNNVFLEFSDFEGQARIFRSENDKDFMYMLMPLRLSPQDLVNDDEEDDSDFGAPENKQAESVSQQEEDSGNGAPQEEPNDSNEPF